MIRLTCATTLAFLVAACGGDDDPPVDGSLVDARVTDAPPPDASSDATVDAPPFAGPDISGTFLVAVHAAFETSNDPALYVQFLVTWAVEPEPSTLDGSYVPLCTSTTCAVHRAQLPPPLVAIDTALAATGSFDQPLVGTLPGEANPFSGTSQPFDASFHAELRSPDLVCGTLTGVVAGLDLAGSTFAAQRVTDLTPAALPAPIAACPAPSAGAVTAPTISVTAPGGAR